MLERCRMLGGEGCWAGETKIRAGKEHKKDIEQGILRGDIEPESARQTKRSRKRKK